MLGTPGFDMLRSNELKSEKEKAQFIKEVGPTVGQLGVALADFNREVRLPIDRRLGWLQRPARISQNWSLYRDGPSRVRRMEVRIDGALRHRSADPEYDWRSPQLRSRRVRPVVEASMMEYASQNWEGLTHVIVHMAREDFPDCEVVELTAMEGPFPGEKMEAKFTLTAEAPEWTPERAWVPAWAEKKGIK